VNINNNNGYLNSVIFSFRVLFVAFNQSTTTNEYK